METTLTLLELCRKVGVEKFIFSSSNAVVGMINYINENQYVILFQTMETANCVLRIIVKFILKSII